MTHVKTKKQKLQEEYERAVLFGLLEEWENALWNLTPVHRMRMKTPYFVLSDMNHTLGAWLGDRMEIRLSRHFVMNHPWDSVREVLFHEMAHQYAECVLGAGNEPPHGGTFLEACRRLRANPKASGTYKSLHEQVHDESPHGEDRMIRRITKLMALAESKNQHEAEAAMVKAHALIAKYNVDLLERREDRSFFSIFLGKPALRHPRETVYLSRLLQDFYYVECIWVPAFVLEKGKMGRVLEISGTRHNLKIAEYIYSFVLHYIDSKWSVYNKDRGFNRYRKTDFAVGIIEGFTNKLEAQRAASEEGKGDRALVKVEDPLLTAYFKHRYPYTSNRRRPISNQDEGILNDGRREGRKMVISKGISKSRKSGKLLPGT